MQYKHFALLVRDRISKLGDKNALMYKSNEKKWIPITYQQLGEQVDSLSKSLIRFGLKEFGNAAILAPNMPEWTIADLAIMSVRGVSVPLYTTSSDRQIEYILNETESEIIFVGGQAEYNKIIHLADKLTYLKLIVAFEDNVTYSTRIPSIVLKDFVNEGASSALDRELKERLSRVQPDDLLTIIYTSGTTGEPKGTMLLHSNIDAAIRSHDIRLIMSFTDVSLCFLPLCHVFERAWTFIVLHTGMTSYYLKNPKDVIETMQEVKPTIMCAVPRFFEKTYGGIMNAVDGYSALKKKLFNWAVKTGTAVAELKRQDKTITGGLKISYKIADMLVLKKIRAILGGNVRFMPCAGAALAPHIAKFFHAVGIHVTVGYGLTETTATVSCFKVTGFKFESAGNIMPDTEVKIGENDEILVKAGSVMAGYYKKPEITAQVLKDGWFRTGDAGWVDEDDCLYFKERIKEIIKTSSGKMISPQYVESLIGQDQYIEQVVVIGNERKYLTALIVPNVIKLKEYAHGMAIPYTDMEDLIRNPDIRELFWIRIDKIQKVLASYEMIARFTLLPAEFTVEGGELTSTLKLKRNFIGEKYRDLIEAMYVE